MCSYSKFQIRLYLFTEHSNKGNTQQSKLSLYKTGCRFDSCRGTRKRGIGSYGKPQVSCNIRSISSDQYTRVRSKGVHLRCTADASWVQIPVLVKHPEQDVKLLIKLWQLSWLERSTVNRDVGGSIPSRSVGWRAIIRKENKMQVMTKGSHRQDIHRWRG